MPTLKASNTTSAPEGTRAVIRAFQVFEELCKHPKGIRIAELTQKTNLNKATIFRLLSTLVSLGYAEQDTRTEHYHPTMKILSFSTKVLDKFELRGVAAPDMQELSQRTTQAVHLSIAENNMTVIVEKVEIQSYFKVASHIGRRSCLYSTGTGKTYLASLTEKELAEYLDTVRFTSHTQHTICNPLQLREALQQIQKQGYATDKQENTLGVSCIAAPIYDFLGNYIAGISVTGFSSEIEKNEKLIAPLVIATTNAISKKLGFIKE